MMSRIVPSGMINLPPPAEIQNRSGFTAVRLSAEGGVDRVFVAKG
jgi:hypothetical protein